jgi:SOS response regulatory protein OraA/RecX
MREIEKAFRSNWGDYITNLIKENNQVTAFFYIEDHLIKQKTHSASYSELKKLKIPQSTLNEVLKNTTELGWLHKQFNSITRQFEYYSTNYLDYSQSNHLIGFVQKTRNPIWLYVFDNPNLEASQKVEIALDYMIFLLDEYGRGMQLKQIDKHLRGKESKINYDLQHMETVIKINFALAKRFKFEKELERQLLDHIPSFDIKEAHKVIESTQLKLKKYKLPITIY